MTTVDNSSWKSRTLLVYWYFSTQPLGCQVWVGERL